MWVRGVVWLDIILTCWLRPEKWASLTVIWRWSTSKFLTQKIKHNQTITPMACSSKRMGPGLEISLHSFLRCLYPISPYKPRTWHTPILGNGKPSVIGYCEQNWICTLNTSTGASQMHTRLRVWINMKALRTSFVFMPAWELEGLSSDVPPTHALSTMETTCPYERLMTLLW